MLLSFDFYLSTIMKRLLSLSVAVFCLSSVFAAFPLTYNGEVLPWNYGWKKTQCGTLDIKANIKEVSGIACSRVTPGYIWMQSDDYEDHIIATDEKGDKRYFTVKFTENIRGDWEDMSGGVYEGVNYLFIGAFGDNGESWGDYSIVYLEEPAIDPENPELTVEPRNIRFVYPDGKKHNCEALMYDNLTSELYIITKVYYDVCQVFRLPFRLDYGTEKQTLEYICDLGTQEDIGFGPTESGQKRYKGFHLVTAADISPDGKYVLIKNHNNIVASYCWVLYWVRQEGESIADVVKRQPQPIRAYNTYEWQGEAICWLDDDTFYTTSDADDGNPPIFKFTRKWGEGTENIRVSQDSRLVMVNNIVYIQSPQGLYTLDGRRVHE